MRPWCEFVTRADGISELERKGRRGHRASRERVSNSCLRSVSEKNLNSDDHFDRSFAPYRNGNQTIKKKGKTMKPLTHFKKIRILRKLLSLGAIFALAITAHAQNLYVSANAPESHKIFEYTPSGVQSIY